MDLNQIEVLIQKFLRLGLIEVIGARNGQPVYQRPQTLHFSTATLESRKQEGDLRTQSVGRLGLGGGAKLPAIDR